MTFMSCETLDRAGRSAPEDGCGMAEADQVSQLIGDIYDASLDPGRWPDVLRKVGEYIGGSGASLSSQETWRRSARG